MGAWAGRGAAASPQKWNWTVRRRGSPTDTNPRQHLNRPLGSPENTGLRRHLNRPLGSPENTGLRQHLNRPLGPSGFLRKVFACALRRSPAGDLRSAICAAHILPGTICQRPPALLARRHRPPPAPQPPPRPFGLPTAGDLAPLGSARRSDSLRSVRSTRFAGVCVPKASISERADGSGEAELRRQVHAPAGA